jgi:spore maturation protein CgeB
MRLVIFGLSLSSSWGNGHATTYRALLRGLAQDGHQVLFLERDQPWYAANRDLPAADWCDLMIYESLGDLDRYKDVVRRADAVVIGSYVPDGPTVIDWAHAHAGGVRAFYDIDTPITLAGLATGTTTYLRADQVPLFDVYLSFTGGPVLELLRDRYGARQAAALYCSVDAEHYRPMDLPWRWDLGYLGTYSADRQPALERMLLEPARRLPDRRFVVAGPQYPADIVWPANVERIDHLPPAEHPAFFCSMDWTLNVTRQDMVRMGHSPSVRLFEATACATPVMSDRWPGIEDVLLPGRDILVLDDTAQVIEALAMPQDASQAIGRAGRVATLRRHTGRQRATELMSHLARAATSCGTAAT